MAVFIREPSSDYVATTLTKAEIIGEIEEIMADDFPAWYVMHFNSGTPADLLLIRSYDKLTKQTLNPNSPNPVHRDKEQKLQIVIAISVYEKQRDMPVDYDLKTKPWTHAHIATNSVKKVLTAIQKIEEEN